MLGWTLLGLLALIVVGVAIALREASHAENRLNLLGFKKDLDSGDWVRRGHQLTLKARSFEQDLEVYVVLPPSPIAYRTVVRALGRGDLLALFHELAVVTTGDRVSLKLTLKVRLRIWFQQLRQFESLVHELMTLNLAEGATLWFLERQRFEENLEEPEEQTFARILDAFPDSPEVRQLCLVEAQRQGSSAVKAIAAAKLEQVSKAHTQP